MEEWTIEKLSMVSIDAIFQKDTSSVWQNNGASITALENINAVRIKG